MLEVIVSELEVSLVANKGPTMERSVRTQVSIEDYQILIWILISWLAACIFNFVSSSEIFSFLITFCMYMSFECNKKSPYT